MPRMIFVNLPVADLARATTFYEAIGMSLDPRFSNDIASAMVWSDAITFMLLHRDFYATFTTKPIIDAHATSGVLLALTQDDRAAVDAITDAAVAAGGREPQPPRDLGFMYGRTFEDLDGHVFEPSYMDLDAAMAATPGETEDPR